MWPGGDVPPPCCVNPEESSQIQRCLEHGLEITKVQDSEREGETEPFVAHFNSCFIQWL